MTERHGELPAVLLACLQTGFSANRLFKRAMRSLLARLGNGPKPLALGLICASLLVSQATAQQANSENAAQAFVEVCIGGFPDQAAMKRRAEAAGLTDVGSTKWAGTGFWIDLGKVARLDGACRVTLNGRATQADLSNALKAKLGGLRVQSLKATQRGQTLKARFSKDGVCGTFKVSRVAGISATALLHRGENGC